jgi:hypothetical protein
MAQTSKSFRHLGPDRPLWLWRCRLACHRCAPCGHLGSDSFLAQKIEVGVAAGTRIDDCGKVPGLIVGITLVYRRKAKGDLQSDLRRPNDFTVFPRLTVNRDFTTGSNCIQERLAICFKLPSAPSFPSNDRPAHLAQLLSCLSPRRFVDSLRPQSRQRKTSGLEISNSPQGHPWGATLQDSSHCLLGIA